MSTIHDALKKVQNNNPEPQEPAKPKINPVTGQPVTLNPASAQFKPPQSQKPKDSKLFLKVLGQIAILIILIAACLMAAKYYGFLDRIQLPRWRISLPSMKSKPRSPYTIKPVKGKPQPAPLSLSDLQISGTMSLDGKTIVLINGVIYEVGDKILNAEIVSISKNEIVFSENGMPRTIPIRK